MLLKEISNSSNYITDENIQQVNLISTINQAIAHVNTKARTELPFAIAENIDLKEYKALSNNWQIRLFEPYTSWVIASSDESDTTDWHWQRFLMALNDFVNSDGSGINELIDPVTGESTNYKGTFGNVKKMDAKETAMNWFRI